MAVFATAEVSLSTGLILYIVLFLWLVNEFLPLVYIRDVSFALEYT